MDTGQITWQSPSLVDLPPSFTNILSSFNISPQENFISQILWNRNIRTVDQLKIFLDCDSYESLSIFEGWSEVIPSVYRLKAAVQNK